MVERLDGFREQTSLNARLVFGRLGKPLRSSVQENIIKHRVIFLMALCLTNSSVGVSLMAFNKHTLLCLVIIRVTIPTYSNLFWRLSIHLLAYTENPVQCLACHWFHVNRGGDTQVSGHVEQKSLYLWVSSKSGLKMQTLQPHQIKDGNYMPCDERNKTLILEVNLIS